MWIFLADARLFFFLLGEALHQLQLLHWFPLLIDGDELQRNARNTNKASPNLFQVLHQLIATGNMNSCTVACTDINIITLMSQEQAGANLIRFLLQ